MRKPKVADETMAALECQRQRALDVLAQSAEHAVKTIVELLDCEKPSVRLAAAELVLGIVGCRPKPAALAQQTNVVIGADVAERLFRVAQEVGCSETVARFLLVGRGEGSTDELQPTGA